MRWIKKKTGPAAATLADKDALAAAEKEHEVIAVAYFKELKVRGRGGLETFKPAERGREEGGRAPGSQRKELFVLAAVAASASAIECCDHPL